MRRGGSYVVRWDAMLMNALYGSGVHFKVEITIVQCLAQMFIKIWTELPFGRNWRLISRAI